MWASSYSLTTNSNTVTTTSNISRKKLFKVLHFFGMAINYAARTAMALCMPHMSKEFQWNKKQQSLVLSCFLWGYPLLQIVGGRLADQYGGEIVILTAATMWSTVTYLTPLLSRLNASNALLLVILSRAAQGLTQGVHFPSVMSLLARHVSDEERTAVYSFIGSGTHFGALSIGLFGSLILGQYGWSAVFRYVGLLGLLWVGALYQFSDLKQARHSSTKDQAILHSDPAGSPSFPWSVMLKQPPFWAMLAAHFTQGYTFFVFLFWLPSFFHEVYPQAQPWVYNVLPWLMDMIVSIGAGSIATALLRLGYSTTFVRKFLNVFAELFFGLSLILMSHNNSFYLNLFLVCTAAAAHGFYQSTVMMNPSDLAPSYTGVLFGIMNTCGALPGYLGFISGYILETTHDWFLMFSITGAVVIVGWFIFACFGTGEPLIKQEPLGITKHI